MVQKIISNRSKKIRQLTELQNLNHKSVVIFQLLIRMNNIIKTIYEKFTICNYLAYVKFAANVCTRQM